VHDTPAAKMQGQAATTFMPGLDFTTTWTATRGYPILQAQATGDEQPPVTVNTVEAANVSAVQSEQVLIPVTVTTPGTGEGLVVAVRNTSGLTDLENATATTDQNGTATFIVTESTAGTYTPTFGVAGDSTVSTTTLTVEEGVVRTYTREDGTPLKAAYQGNGTPENPYLIDSLADLQAINNSTAARDEHYQLAANIDASATSDSSWNGGNGFEPITEFNGTLDGAGNTITDLSVNRSGTSPTGLIGVTESASVISNLTLANASSPGTTTSERWSAVTPGRSRT
jgi:hypothetical protein